jgi:hypothetical protein
MKLQKGDPVLIKNNGGYGAVDHFSDGGKTVFVRFNDGHIFPYDEEKLELDKVQSLIDEWKADRLTPISQKDRAYMRGYIDALHEQPSYFRLSYDEKEKLYRHIGIGERHGK